MKRASLALLALLAGACQRPAPVVPAERPRPVGPESTAYAAARRYVEEDLRRRYGADLGGWTLPDSVTEANMVRDFKRPDDYQVVLTAAAPGRAFLSYVVKLRRVGDEYRLVSLQQGG